MPESHRIPRRQRGKALIAMFVAAATLAGGSQALAPPSAGAVIYDDITETQCYRLFGEWDWFNGTCDVNFGGGSGGKQPSYGNAGRYGQSGGGGGSANGKGGTGGGSGNSSPRTPRELAEAKAEEERRRSELERLRELKSLMDSIERARQQMEQLDLKRDCVQLKSLEQEILDEWLDGTLVRFFKHGSKKKRAERVAAQAVARGCNTLH